MNKPVIYVSANEDTLVIAKLYEMGYEIIFLLEVLYV